MCLYAALPFRLPRTFSWRFVTSLLLALPCRLLDPSLSGSYQPAILSRPPHAVVVSLERVKLVLTPDSAFLGNLQDGVAISLAEEVCRSLAARAAGANAAAVTAGVSSGRTGGGVGALGGIASGMRASKSLAHLGCLFPAAAGGVSSQLELPFELQVLEVALEMVRLGGGRSVRGVRGGACVCSDPLPGPAWKPCWAA